MSGISNHSWLDGTVLVNGIQLQQFDAGDDVITFERRVDSATDKMGADGDMIVSLGTDKSGTVTFRLLQTSDSNKYMRGLVAAADAGVFTELALSYTNPTSNESVVGVHGYIKKQSGKTRGVQSNAQTWELVFGELQFLDT